LTERKERGGLDREVRWGKGDDGGFKG